MSSITVISSEHIHSQLFMNRHRTKRRACTKNCKIPNKSYPRSAARIWRISIPAPNRKPSRLRLTILGSFLRTGSRTQLVGLHVQKLPSAQLYLAELHEHSVTSHILNQKNESLVLVDYELEFSLPLLASGRARGHSFGIGCHKLHA